MGFERVTILGVGLLGASVARAMKKRTMCSHVTGHGRREENLQKALSLGYIDAYEADPAKACGGADLIVLATPVERFRELMEKAASSIKKGALVIDVGSLKGGLYRDIVSMMPEGVDFVGCHPIAGGESSGLDASDADLFVDSLCIITEDASVSSGAIGRAASLWESLGSKVEYLDADIHDRVYGLVSHFPHVAAYALVNAVGDADSGALKYAGPGFLDTTRIALSPADLWKNICLLNRNNLVEFIDTFIKELQHISRLLKEGDAEGIEKHFEKARNLRRDIGS